MTVAKTVSLVATPYVGPQAFREDDQEIFFGRESESRQLGSLVIAHRAVLLYAQSGAGKTSLLQASLVPELKRRKRLIALPIGRVSGEARDDVKNIFVYNTLLNMYGKDARPAELAALSLSQGLAPFMEPGNGRRPRPRLLILDQFEELFTTHVERYPDRSDFFTQLQDCLQDYPALSLLLSMREDYIAHLDAYAQQLPDRLRTRFRLERLGPVAALAAIKGPLAKTGSGRHYAPDVAEALVENLRRVQRRVITETGSDVTYVPGPDVEPVHLQIVCQQLWNNLPPERELIELDDVQQFGDVDQALTEFYEQALQAALPQAGVGERRLRGWFDTRLITPAQTRGLLFRGEVETEGLPNAALDVLVNKYIVRADIRGGETWYELSHDRLVEPILAANRAWREAHTNPLAAAVEAWQSNGESDADLARGTQLAELEAYAAEHAGDITAEEHHYLDESRRVENQLKAEAARRNQRRVVIGAGAIVAILVAFSIWAFINADRASDAQATAQINERIADELRATAVADAIVQADLREEADQKAAAASTAEAEAGAARAIAEANERLAVAARAAADAAREEAEQLKIQIQASQLAAASRAELDEEPELALLLAAAGLGISRQADTEASWYAATFSPFRGSLRGHTASVRSAAFSPDGERVVTASGDGTARLWDREGSEPVVLAGHTGRVNSAAFSPDGTRVVTASDDSTARLWDAVTGEGLAVLEGHHPWSVNSAAFSPDGMQVLTVSQDRTARLWDVATGEELAVLPGHHSVYSAAFSPNGARIVTGGCDGELGCSNGTARLWDWATGEELAVLAGHADVVYSAAFSPDGSRVATANSNGTVQLWDTATGEEFAVLAGHTRWVNSAAFSPDGTQVVTVGCDESIADSCLNGPARLWDVATGEELAMLRGNDGSVNSAAFNPDGTRVVTASDDSTARLWDAVTGEELAVLAGHSGWVNSAAFSPDGIRVITASQDGTARLWAVGAELAVLAEDGPVYSAAFSPDGTRVVTAGCDGPDHPLCLNGTSQLWNPATGEKLALLAEDGWVNSAAYSPDGTRVVTAGCDEWGQGGCAKATAQLWDAVTGEELALLAGHTGWLNSAAFSPDGTQVVTASQDGTARLWDAVTGEELALLAEDGSVYTAAFSPDGARVVTASQDGRLWDTTTGEVLAVLAEDGWVNSAAYSPDGTRVVTTGNDGGVRLWDGATGEKLAVLKVHAIGVNSAAFSPDGMRLVTTGCDAAAYDCYEGSARLWPSYLSLESKLAVARERLSRAFTSEECRRFFRDDPDTCPQTLDALFALFDDVDS